MMTTIDQQVGILAEAVRKRGPSWIRPDMRQGAGVAPGRMPPRRPFDRPARLGRGDAQNSAALADPANLPFSSADPKTPGLYVEIGEAIGRAMGRPVAPVWSRPTSANARYGRRCSPASATHRSACRRTRTSWGRESSSPNLFCRSAMRWSFEFRAAASLDDLKGRRVAVQFATTPQGLLAYRDDIQTVTFRDPEEAMRALAAGQVTPPSSGDRSPAM